MTELFGMLSDVIRKLKKNKAPVYHEGSNNPEIIFSQGDIFVVRHAESENNVAGDVYRPNPHLTPIGKRQAELLGKLLKKNRIKFDTVVTSGSTRAVETAEAIIEELGLQIAKNQFVANQDLRERDIGCYNLPRSEQQRVMREFSSHRHSLPSDQVWDDIPNTIQGLDTHAFETERQTATRFTESLKKTSNTYPKKNILVISHTRTMSSGAARLLTQSPQNSKQSPFRHISNTGYFTVRKDQTSPVGLRLVHMNPRGVK